MPKGMGKGHVLHRGKLRPDSGEPFTWATDGTWNTGSRFPNKVFMGNLPPGLRGDTEYLQAALETLTPPVMATNVHWLDRAPSGTVSAMVHVQNNKQVMSMILNLHGHVCSTQLILGRLWALLSEDCSPCQLLEGAYANDLPLHHMVLMRSCEPCPHAVHTDHV